MNLKIGARDIIALVLLVGCLVLLGLGYNDKMLYIAVGIALAYGVIQIPRPDDWRR